MHGCRLSLVLLAALVCADSARAQSFGHWNIPSTTAQFWGCGNGAGHHAPMVRSLGGRPPRVPRVALVPACQLQHAELRYESFPAGCAYGEGFCPGEPTFSQPVTHQAPVTHPQGVSPLPPVFAQPQSIFAPPTATQPTKAPAPASRTSEKGTMSEPAMPSADSKATEDSTPTAPDDSQAWYDF